MASASAEIESESAPRVNPASPACRASSRTRNELSSAGSRASASPANRAPVNVPPHGSDSPSPSAYGSLAARATSDDRANTAPVLQARCENGRNQNWKLVKSEFRAGYFMVQVKHSKKCLDVVDFRLDHGAPVVQADCRDTDNQQWKLEPVGNDAPLYYHLINYNSEQCLDVQDSSVAHGANVIQGNCWDGSNQRWQFDKK
ncbi:RICIN domain-containing protein [Nocardia sp. NPDC004604]|uniref:RICIN domain-containing protein n=1 Tax=Nocardia sp. NPDC004604 TaxID=3157013 RepID=UPI0033B624C0